MKASKNYKKQYKEGLQKVAKPEVDSSWSPQRLDLISDAEGRDLFNCERRNPGGEFDHVPFGEREAQQWLKNRRVDKHLDLDFLPRSLVYNIDDLAASSKQMEAVLRQMADAQEEGKVVLHDDTVERSTYSRNIFSKARGTPVNADEDEW